jgi:hypothetical protein
MRMLENLKEVLDEIEQANEWEYKFTSDMLIRHEQGEKLTDKQFAKLVDVHEKYCGTGK